MDSSSIWDFDDYKVWWQGSYQEHGELRRLAEHLRVSPGLMSQVFGGDRHLTIEQAHDLAQFYQLTPKETNYLHHLLHFARAGSDSLKKFYQRQCQKLRAESQNLKHRVNTGKRIASEAQARYYSQWHYSAIRIAMALPDCKNVSSIAVALSLEESLVSEIVGWMIEQELVRETSEGLTLTTVSTFLPRHHPLLPAHHTNWRLRAIQQVARVSDHDLVYTCPLSISAEDAPKVRQILLNAIAEAMKVVDPSPAEQLYLFNVDWMKLV